ncbi:MAG: CapA family protein [Roseburia sp.]|nr:CapA family protein [Roseburia sp.]
MSKKVRITLYLISLVISMGVLVLLIFNGKLLKTTASDEVEQQSEMETEQIESTENIIETEVEQESGEITTIVFAGDILIAAAMEQYYDAEGVGRIVSEELLTEMQNADICMVNNEFQFSNRGIPMEDKQFTFQTDPKYVQILLDMGVDIVSLANNHSLDFGTEALEDTFVTLDEAGILYAGAGDTKERAEQLQVIEANGQKIGFLAATRVIPVSEWNVEYRQPGLFATYDDTRLLECIREAKEECDFLAVYVHWGIEREAYPQEYQTDIAKNCFAAGADLVIGAHPHVLQGIEFIDGKPVFYSLGNYVFSQEIAKTALVKVEIYPDGEVSYRLIPAYAKGGKTQLFNGEEAEELFQYMNEISTGRVVDEQGNVYELR